MWQGRGVVRNYKLKERDEINWSYVSNPIPPILGDYKLEMNLSFGVWVKMVMLIPGKYKTENVYVAVSGRRGQLQYALALEIQSSYGL